MTLLRDAQREAARLDALGAELDEARARTADPLAEYVLPDAIGREIAAREFLVEGLIQRGRVYQLFGSWKSGKSTLALDCCAHGAHARDMWAGRRIVPFVVVWIAGESCEETEGPAPTRIGPNMRTALDALGRLYVTHRDNLKAGGLDPAAARVLVTDWRAACKGAGLDRRRVTEAIKALHEQKLVIIESGYASLTDTGEAVRP